jgi:hypothetical protein
MLVKCRVTTNMYAVMLWYLMSLSQVQSMVIAATSETLTITAGHAVVFLHCIALQYNRPVFVLESGSTTTCPAPPVWICRCEVGTPSVRSRYASAIHLANHNLRQPVKGRQEARVAVEGSLVERGRDHMKVVVNLGQMVLEQQQRRLQVKLLVMLAGSKRRKPGRHSLAFVCHFVCG